MLIINIETLNIEFWKIHLLGPKLLLSIDLININCQNTDIIL